MARAEFIPCMAAAFSVAACTSLELARPTFAVQTERLGVGNAGVRLEEPGSPRCKQLDSRAVWLGITGYSSAALGASFSSGTVLPDDDTSKGRKLRTALLLTGLGFAGVSVGLLWGQARTSQEWTAEGCGR